MAWLAVDTDGDALEWESQNSCESGASLATMTAVQGPARFLRSEQGHKYRGWPSLGDAISWIRVALSAYWEEPEGKVNSIEAGGWRLRLGRSTTVAGFLPDFPVMVRI